MSFLYNTYMLWFNIEQYKNIEKFENTNRDDDYDYTKKAEETYTTTLEAYKKGSFFDDENELNKQNYQNLLKYNDVDNNFPFTTYGCIQTSPGENIMDTLSKLFYVSYSEFYSLSINDIFDVIVNDLTRTMSKIKEEPIEDPVYVLIYQAPNLSFNDENFAARIDSVNNLKTSYNQNIDNVRIGYNPLYTKIYVIYPKYFENNGKITNYNNEDGLNKFKNFFQSKMTRNKLCFIECNAVNNYSCGCLNKKSHEGYDFSYKSKCVEYNNQEWDYGMIYSLNKFNSLFSKKIKRVAFNV